MARYEYQVAECPICGRDTVEIPILGWDTSFEQKTGLQGFFPKLGTPKCTRGCKLPANAELEVTDHMWRDQ